VVTYYEILEVSESASKDTIRAAFRALSKKYHPDNKKTGDAEKFRLLNEAHECLTDETKRRFYDGELYKSRMADTGGAATGTRTARQSAEGVTPQTAFDPSKGVEALLTLGQVALRQYGVDPVLVGVFQQMQPNLHEFAVQAIRRLAQ